MKKLILLPLLVIATACFSQDTVKLPTAVAKQVVKDLLDHESLKLQLHLVKEQLELTEKKCLAKDTIIANHRYKFESCEARVELEKQKIDLYKEETKRLKKEYRKLKIKSTFTQIGSGAIIATLAYFLIMK